MKKRKFSPEDVENARKKWAEAYPEQASRREAKKQAALLKEETETPEKQKEAREHIAENFPIFPPVTEKEKALEEYVGQVAGFAAHIREKCDAYVRSRNLEDAVLTATERQIFSNTVLSCYHLSPVCLELQMQAEELLIDGLRYPDTAINEFCVNFLRRVQQQGKNISWTLWMNLWSRPFVPADAIRLMVFSEDGVDFYKIAAFEEIVQVLKKKIKWHLAEEYNRLCAAKRIEDFAVREREMERKTRRIRLFEKLIAAYRL